LITAFSDASMQAEATRLGAVALITKPFDLDEMRALVCAVESRRLH
jgi:DNA-binding response OmpR family regulator